MGYLPRSRFGATPLAELSSQQGILKILLVKFILSPSPRNMSTIYINITEGVNSLLTSLCGSYIKTQNVSPSRQKAITIYNCELQSDEL